MCVVQELELPEWRLVTMVVSDDHNDNYFKVQLDVLPETMQEQDFKNATDVSTVL